MQEIIARIVEGNRVAQYRVFDTDTGVCKDYIVDKENPIVMCDNYIDSNNTLLSGKGYNKMGDAYIDVTGKVHQKETEFIQSNLDRVGYFISESCNAYGYIYNTHKSIARDSTVLDLYKVDANGVIKTLTYQRIGGELTHQLNEEMDLGYRCLEVKGSEVAILDIYEDRSEAGKLYVVYFKECEVYKAEIREFMKSEGYYKNSQYAKFKEDMVLFRTILNKAIIVTKQYITNGYKANDFEKDMSPYIVRGNTIVKMRNTKLLVVPDGIKNIQCHNSRADRLVVQNDTDGIVGYKELLVNGNIIGKDLYSCGSADKTIAVSSIDGMNRLYEFAKDIGTEVETIQAGYIKINVSAENTLVVYNQTTRLNAMDVVVRDGVQQGILGCINKMRILDSVQIAYRPMKGNEARSKENSTVVEVNVYRGGSKQTIRFYARNHIELDEGLIGIFRAVFIYRVVIAPNCNCNNPVGDEWNIKNYVMDLNEWVRCYCKVVNWE